MVKLNYLKKILFDEYDGFADKRIKRLESGSTFIVDNRGVGDVGADRNLFSWFCSVFVNVLDENHIVVRLIGGVPINAKIKAWVNKNGHTLSTDKQTVLELALDQKNTSELLELADLMEAIVAKGKTYDIKAYKYVCPRTAASLRRLEKTLSRWPD